MLRLSQVYCWYAEATGRAGEINDQAVKVLNEVRNRADGEDTDKYTTDMSPDKLAEAAYDEHGWEMAGYYWGGELPAEPGICLECTVIRIILNPVS